MLVVHIICTICTIRCYERASLTDFVMELSPNGELLKWIKKLGSFDEECTVRGWEAAELLDRTVIAVDSGSQ